VAYASTQNILAACLPGVAMEAVAESFLSCKDKKMEEICTFAKRGWLVKDSKEETVPNLDLLTSSFSGLKGGAEAVKKCMKVKEEAESLDDYYYYDYDYYYDEYDYMEEGEGMEVRRKREAGKKSNKNNKNAARRERRKKKRTNKKPTKPKNRRRNNKKGNSNRNGGKKNKGSGKKNKGSGNRSNKNSRSNPKKKGKGKGKKNKNTGNEQKNDRKYVNKKPDKEPSKENEEKIKNRLAKLGFTKMPTPSTLSGLECLWDELENLLVACAENIASTNP